MRVIEVAQNAVTHWEEASPFELVCRAANLVRELLPLANPTPHPKWQEVEDAFLAEHVVSFTTPEGRPHRVLLHSWWRITDDSEFIFSLRGEPTRDPSDLIGVIVGLCVALFAYCPRERSDPEYVDPITFPEAKRRLLAHLDMIAKLHGPREPANA
jgi:hypothetical protein